MREGLGSYARRFVAHQVFALQIKQLGIFPLGLAPPLVELGAVAQSLGNDLIVEGVNQLVVDQHIGAPRLMFERFNVEHQLVVVCEEGPAPRIFLGNLAFNQTLADENVARFLWVHRPEIHPLFRVNDDAVERRTLESDDLHRLFFPMRIEPATLDQVSAHFLQPLRFNAGHAAGEKL